MAISRQELWELELEQLYKERETTEPDPDMWRWSPLELSEFDRMLAMATHQLAGTDPIRFCEAGCGIGTKLYLAEHYHGLEAVGYEISDDYLAKALALGVDARYMDLRESSPPWSEYDIVYTARPFKDDEVEVAWEKSVWEGMRPGAILMMAYTAVKPYSWPCHYRAPFRGVWSKPVDVRTRSIPVYDAIISRMEPHDPLVPEPGPGG
jgi:SAM-dependent methyltransferase